MLELTEFNFAIVSIHHRAPAQVKSPHETRFDSATLTLIAH